MCNMYSSSWEQAPPRSGTTTKRVPLKPSTCMSRKTQLIVGIFEKETAQLINSVVSSTESAEIKPCADVKKIFAQIIHAWIVCARPNFNHNVGEILKSH